MARTKSEFLKAFGKSFEVFKAITDEVLDRGGTDEDIERILKEKDLRVKLADLIVARPDDTFTVTVNYDDPQWQTIDRDRYAYIGDVTVNDYPVTETGTKPVRFREVAFDHGPTDQEVLDRMAQLNCRQPDRAEAETAIRRCTPEQLREHPRIGLIGPAVRRDGDLNRAYVYGRGLGVDLYWDWTGPRWLRYCRFVVVCN